MRKLASKLRIGEKLAISFGLVGLLFLLVIWQYHVTFYQSLADYRGLQETYGMGKSHALAIESSMLNARRAEKSFLLDKSMNHVEVVSDNVDAVLREAAELGSVNDKFKPAADRITTLTGIYHQQFLAIVDAWRTQGLDHNSGLQGTFRKAIHELEAIAAKLKVGSLYLQLLQIRRAEKDLGLRREAEYRDKALGLIQGLRDKLTESGLDPNFQEQLNEELDVYHKTFEVYAKLVLDQQDIQGGKGPFRGVTLYGPYSCLFFQYRIIAEKRNSG